MLGCTAVLLLGFVPCAQEPESSVLIQRTAVGARIIARDFALPNWAVKMVAQDRPLAKTDEDRALLALTECDIALASADRERDPLVRLGLYAAAGAAYGEVLERFGNTVVAQEAQRRVGLTAFQYAQTLDQLFAIEDVTDAQRAELIAAAEPFFKSALAAMNALIRWFDQLPADHPDRDALLGEVYFPTQFFRAITYTSWARIHPADSLERDQYSKTAIEYLENFALEAGGPFGMQAYRLTGDVFVLRSEYGDANDYYRYVVDTCREILVNPEAELTPSQVMGYEMAVMDATLGLLTMHRGAGDEAGFAAEVAAFEQWLRDENVSLQAPGYQIRLLEARDLVDQGRIGEALALAQEVANDNAANAMRLQANAAMAYAIEHAPADAEIPLDVLYQAALGSQQSNEYERAVAFWRALIARLPGSGLEDKYRGPAYDGLSLCWNALDDGMLAAVAAASGFRSGVVDEVYGKKLANRWFVKAESFFRSRPSDPGLKSFNDEALAAYQTVSDDNTPDGVLWRNAENKFRIAEGAAGDASGKPADSREAKAAIAAYRDAAEAYAKLPASSKYYDKATAQRGLCFYKICAWDLAAASEAIATFEAYLAHIADPANAVSDPTAVKYRKESEPTAVYYLGDSLRLVARAGRPGAWESMLAAVDGFREKYPEQPGLAEAVRDARVEAHLALADTDKAEAEFQLMLDEQMGNSRIAFAAYKLQRDFAARAAAAADTEQRRTMLVLAAKYLGIMNQRQSKPSGAGLYTEAQWRAELEEWPTVEKLAAAALEPTANLPEANRFGALALRVEALLEQRRVAEAKPLVEELRAQSPNERRVLTFTIRTLAGFLINDKGTILEVPGDGDAQALMKAYESAGTLIQVAEHEANQAGTNKFLHKPWWDARVDQIYVLYRLGQVDSSQAGTHLRIIDGLRNQAPDLGEQVCGRTVPLKLQWLAQH